MCSHGSGNGGRHASSPGSHAQPPLAAIVKPTTDAAHYPQWMILMMVWAIGANSPPYSPAIDTTTPSEQIKEAPQGYAPLVTRSEHEVCLNMRRPLREQRRRELSSWRGPTRGRARCLPASHPHRHFRGTRRRSLDDPRRVACVAHVLLQ